MTKLTNLQHEAKQITLSHQEKAVMRARIFDTVTPAPSYTVSHFSFFSIKFAPAMAAVLIVALGGGTAYAAQAALPGEVLYTVKVNVNEPVRQALAVSTEAKAAFHTSVAQTRLEEAEALAAEGRLTASTSVDIEQRLEVHLAKAQEVAEKLEDEEKADLAGEVEAELDSALSAHSAILAKLGEESEDEETREHSRSLAGRITSRIFAKFEERAGTSLALKVAAPAQTEVALMVEEDTSASGTLMVAETATSGETKTAPQTDAQKRAAEVLKARAEKGLAEARETFADLEPNLEATTTARVEAQFKTLEEQMVEGEELYNNGDYAGARAAFNAVLRDTIELHAYLRAEQRFNKKFLRSWIDTRFGRVFEGRIEVRLEPEVRGEQTEREDDDSDDRGNEDKDDDKDNSNSSSRVEVKVDLGL